MHSFAIEDFEQLYDAGGNGLPAAQNAWLSGYRQAALALLKSHGLPDRKTEDWKYTSVRALVKEAFVTAGIDSTVSASEPDFPFVLVLSGGHFDSRRSRVDKLPDGVRVADLRTCLETDPDRVKGLLADAAHYANYPFAALNGAFLSDGVVISVEPGVQVQAPLLLVQRHGSGAASLVQPRVLLSLAEHSRLTLVEQQPGSDAAHLSNQLSEFRLGDGASLEHITLSRLNQARLIRGTHLSCARDSHYRLASFDLGGAFSRNDLVVRLESEGASCSLNGLYLAGAGEQVDNHTRIDHLAPHCRSRELYKGVLGRGSHGVFNGKVVVHAGALKTDAQLNNRNLLLAEDVEIDTKPELEIYADDVQCSHSSTVGELDENELYYLRSRGIDLQEARRMLIEAFTAETRDTIADDSLRRQVDALLGPALQSLLRGDLQS